MTAKILIADPSTVIQKALQVAMSHLDVELIMASSCSEAQDLTRQHKPDLILMATQLPGLSTRTLEEIPLGSYHESDRIVFLRGHFETHPVVSSAAHVIVKPFTAETILNTVGPLLSSVDLTPPAVTAGPGPKTFAGSIPQLLEDKLVKQLEALVREYCDKHFKTIAKEVITAELRRLTKERSQQLLDL